MALSTNPTGIINSLHLDSSSSFGEKISVSKGILSIRNLLIALGVSATFSACESSGSTSYLENNTTDRSNFEQIMSTYIEG